MPHINKMKCQQCVKEIAVIIQIPNWRDHRETWVASCGCGSEPMYAIGLPHFWTDMANHINRKPWATPERTQRFIDLAKAMDGNDYKLGYADSTEYAFGNL